MTEFSIGDVSINVKIVMSASMLSQYYVNDFNYEIIQSLFV